NGSVTFNLRQNVHFANGDPFNSSAVAFSINRILTMNQGDSFHVSQFLNSSGIKILGPYQIMFIPFAPDPWFLDLFQLWVTDIVDPLFINAHGGVQKDTVNTYMSTHAMGTGPYEIGSGNYTASTITMTYNPNYWGPRPNITKIIFDVVSSPSTQQAELQQGSINIALQIPLDQMSVLASTPGLKVKAGPTSSEYYIGMDENVTPFNNTDVRIAINYAVNVSQLTANSVFNYGIPLYDTMAPTIEAYIPAFKNYTYNLSMARHYLNLSGYGNGFTTTFYYQSGDPVGTAISTILQSELQAIGIKLNLQAVESATFQTDVGHGTYPMFYEGWVNLLATPDDGLRPLFNSANIGIYGNFNYFNNSTVSHDLVAAGKLYNQSQRDALYIQAQKILAAQAVEVPLFNLENVIPMTSNVHNLLIYPTFDIFFDQVTMT
ncbi:MAG: ABC transporter substrate-binding protein, partial [Candidatus Thermoplasmatota archaeon]|nr:ABC transporter substrate-binding protein [Candidatus Thermoplasmatota archaeon]